MRVSCVEETHFSLCLCGCKGTFTDHNVAFAFSAHPHLYLFMFLSIIHKLHDRFGGASVWLWCARRRASLRERACVVKSMRKVCGLQALHPRRDAQVTRTHTHTLSLSCSVTPSHIHTHIHTHTDSVGIVVSRSQECARCFLCIFHIKISLGNDAPHNQN